MKTVQNSLFLIRPLSFNTETAVLVSALLGSTTSIEVSLFLPIARTSFTQLIRKTDMTTDITRQTARPINIDLLTLNALIIAAF